MKLKALMRWTGPAAIGAGVFMVFSGLSGLPIHVPYLSQNDPNGYQVLGSGLILFALTLLLVGMLGLYASQTDPASPNVIESGAGYPRNEGWEPLEEDAYPEEPRQLVAASGIRRTVTHQGKGRRPYGYTAGAQRGHRAPH
jgi:hypothetical protein